MNATGADFRVVRLLASWACTLREHDADARRRRWENLPDVERARRLAGLVGKALQAQRGVVSDGLPAGDDAGEGVGGPVPLIGPRSPSRGPEVRS